MPATDELILPCQPRVLALLMRELIADAPNLRRVNQLFSADLALALPLLQTANSAAFRMPGQVRSIAQAVVLVGVQPLRALLLKAQSAVAARPTAGLDMAEFGRTSLACAKLARSLAGWTGLDGSTAYMAALLHGVGQLMLHQTQRERVMADAFPVEVALALGVDVDVVLQREAPDWSQSIY